MSKPLYQQRLIRTLNNDELLAIRLAVGAKIYEIHDVTVVSGRIMPFGSPLTIQYEMTLKSGETIFVYDSDHKSEMYGAYKLDPVVRIVDAIPMENLNDQL